MNGLAAQSPLPLASNCLLHAQAGFFPEREAATCMRCPAPRPLGVPPRQTQ
jgi:hypothetical protein